MYRLLLLFIITFPSFSAFAEMNDPFNNLVPGIAKSLEQDNVVPLKQEEEFKMEGIKNLKYNIKNNKLLFTGFLFNKKTKEKWAIIELDNQASPQGSVITEGLVVDKKIVIKKITRRYLEILVENKPYKINYAKNN